MAEIQKTNPANSPELIRKFVQLIMVQTQNILYVLGRIPTPEGERLPPNLQAAKMMIDHLEVIQNKTQGNLSPQEAKILQEALQQVQLAFVEASGGTPVGMMPDRGPQVDLAALEEEMGETSTPGNAPSEKSAPDSTQGRGTSTPQDDEKKKYFKNYG